MWLKIGRAQQLLVEVPYINNICEIVYRIHGKVQLFLI
jgi:hypothetical protein